MALIVKTRRYRPTWLTTTFETCDVGANINAAMPCNACRAPEQTDAEFGARGPHSHVWGFATTMLHLATGEQPYKGLTLVQMISAMVRSRPPSVPATLPAWLQHLLKQCLSFDVAKRATVLQLLQVNPLQPWPCLAELQCCILPNHVDITCGAGFQRAAQRCKRACSTCGYQQCGSVSSLMRFTSSKHRAGISGVHKLIPPLQHPLWSLRNFS